MLLGGIEMGGTKIICGITDENGRVLDKIRFDTVSAKENIPQMLEYFEGKNIDSLGIACFGPLDLRKGSDTYGYITSTPKTGWTNTDLLSPFKKLGVPVGFDTDVNAAALGEVCFGSAKGCESAIYITVGTGIGVGVFVNGRPLHGLMHPEGGHILVRKAVNDCAESVCRCHDNCLEGLASGPSIENRWGEKAEKLYERSDVWELESFYIGQAIVNYIMAYSPEKIILWGGVMHKPGLMELVREQVRKQFGNYFELPDLKELITGPMLGDDVGLIGAAQLPIVSKL